MRGGDLLRNFFEPLSVEVQALQGIVPDIVIHRDFRAEKFVELAFKYLLRFLSADYLRLPVAVGSHIFKE